VNFLSASRDGWRMGDFQAVDSMIRDGLWDALNRYHMGTTAENVAKRHGITREQQDRFAVASQNKAEAAQKAGRFRDEVVTVMVPQRKGEPVSFEQDELVRHGATLEGVSSVRPAFAKAGSVTAANASAGLDPAYMGMDPAPASRRCLEKAGWRTDDLDLMEINEAFAAQACAVNQDMARDPARIT
jgi:acetyl-CoA C-acetyltransferase